MRLIRRLGLPKRFLVIWASAAVLWQSCTVSRITITPPPPHIKRIEGYASLRMKDTQGTARSKFSFLFQLPHQGRIDVTNVLGRTLYRIVIREEGAFLVIPSKRAYWRAKEEEIFGRFLGFSMNMGEIVSLLSGKWEDQRGFYQEEHWREGWILEKDARGRIWRGYRGDLKFEVTAYFKNTSVARSLVFQHPLSEGRLKILDLNYNKPLKERAFSLDFLETCRQKTWQEIEELLGEKKK